MPKPPGPEQLRELDVIDTKQLDLYMQTSLDRHSLQRLRDAFETDACRIVEKLQIATPLLANDGAQVAEDAHALRGIAGNVCAMRLERTAQAIENLAIQKAIDWPSINALATQLSLQVTETVSALNQYLARAE